MTKVEQVSHALRERILSGEWADGKALPSRGQMAQEYAVSEATITGAIRSLQKEGLLRVLQGKGAYVTDFQGNGSAVVPQALIGLTGSYLPSDQELSRIGLDDLFRRSIFDGIWSAANEAHCPVVLLPKLAMQAAVTRDYCLRIGIQGMIFLGGEGYPNALALKQEGFPVILSNQPTEPTTLNYLDYDNAWMTAEAVRRLIEAGHSRIAVFYSEGSVPAYYDSMKLHFLAALQRHRVFYPPDDYWRGVRRLDPGHFGGIREAMEEVLALPQPPTAFLFWEPGIATPALALLEEKGWRDRVAILVSSYASEGEALHSGFVMPHRELGAALVRELTATIRNPHHAAQLLLKPTFVDRQSIPKLPNRS